MGDRYHYDRGGNYTGRSSNNGPYSGLVWVGIILFLCWLFGC